MNEIMIDLNAALILITPIWLIISSIILFTKSKRTEEKIDFILNWIDKNETILELEEIEQQLEELKK